MAKDEKLKNNEVEKIFLLENEMLSFISDHIRPDIKKVILEKINKQKDILLEMADKEWQDQEKINNRKKSAIDDNYFQKKPLNINNI